MARFRILNNAVVAQDAAGIVSAVSQGGTVANPWYDLQVDVSGIPFATEDLLIVVSSEPEVAVGNFIAPTVGSHQVLPSSTDDVLDLRVYISAVGAEFDPNAGPDRTVANFTVLILRP